MSEIIAERPTDFSIRLLHYEISGGIPVRLRKADGDYDAYRMPDGTIVGDHPRFVPALTVDAQVTKTARDAQKTNENRLDELGLSSTKLAFNPSSVPTLVAAFNAIAAGNALTAQQKTAFFAWANGITEYIARDRFHEHAQDKANK